MRTIVLRWKETTHHQAVVNVPDDFDLKTVDEEALDEAVCVLNQDTYYFCEDRERYAIEEERTYDFRQEELFDDE
jgi:hypothetical protein